MRHEIRVLGELGSEFERIAVRRRRRGFIGQRWRPLAVLAVLCLGGATGALAAAGVFRTGTPVGANVPANPDILNGLAVTSSVKLLPLSVEDPRGGPAWGLRYMRTTRGLACLQYGRLVNGTIGALGQDGAFHDDGAFHAFSVNYEQFGRSGMGCSELDRHGSAVFNAIIQQTPSSAIDGDCLPTKASPPPGFSPPRIPVCPRKDLRDIYFGLLGPDAAAITYRATNGHEVTEQTAGPDGAYLIVGRSTAQSCFTAILRGHAVTVRGHVIHPCGNGWSSSAILNAYGVISAVHYRNGHVCRMGPLGWCPPVGVTQVSERPVTAAQVRSPVTVTTSLGWRFCWNGKPGSAIACRGRPPHGYRLTPAFHGQVRPTGPGGRPEVRAIVSFTARVPIRNIDSTYEYSYWLRTTRTIREHDKACQAGDLSTASGETHYDIHAGQRITETIYADEQCPGTIHGVIEYASATNPTSPIIPLIAPRQGHVLQVGTFSFNVP